MSILLFSKPALPFSPTDFGSLDFWMAPRLTETITNVSGAASQITDLSGSNRHASQSTAANRPATGVNNINGRNVLTFDAVNDALTLAISIPARTAYTVYFVGRLTSMSANRTVFAGNTGSYQYRALTTTGNLQNVRQAQSPILQASIAPTLNTPFLAVARATSSGGAHWFNGAAAGSSPTPLSPTDVITTIGSLPGTPTQGWQGDMGDLLIYGADHSTAQRNAVTSYLASIYGITLSA